MFWAGSLVLRFIIALILNTMIIVGLKFTFDKCSANTGFHYFISEMRLSEGFCAPFSRWVNGARAEQNDSYANKGMFNAAPTEHWLTTMFSSDTSLTRAFGLHSLPLAFVEEPTSARIAKLIILWLMPPFLLALLVEAFLSFRSGR